MRTFHYCIYYVNCGKSIELVFHYVIRFELIHLRTQLVWAIKKDALWNVMHSYYCHLVGNNDKGCHIYNSLLLWWCAKWRQNEFGTRGKFVNGNCNSHDILYEFWIIAILKNVDFSLFFFFALRFGDEERESEPSKLNYRMLSLTKSFNDMNLNKSHSKLYERKRKRKLKQTTKQLCALQFSREIMKFTFWSAMDFSNILTPNLSNWFFFSFILLQIESEF